MYANKTEKNKRFNNFKTNDDIIMTHNEKFSKNEVTYKMDHNQFSDMTWEEFSKVYLNPISSMKKNQPQKVFSFKHNNSTHVEVNEDSLSYQKYCLPPLNQLNSNDGWALALAAQIEAQLKINNFRFETYISPQYILDCSGTNRSISKNSIKALEFLKAKGLVSLLDYQYVAHKQECNKKAPKMSEIISYTDSQWLYAEEDDLKFHLNAIGPVAIAAYISNSFYKYKSGIFNDDNCPNDCETLNHMMVLVGYGTDYSGVDYWLVKNSWGSSWGESGYIRMIRNHNNNCNIACAMYYATV